MEHLDHCAIDPVSLKPISWKYRGRIGLPDYNPEGHEEYAECANVHRSFPCFQSIPPFLVLVVLNKIISLFLF